MLCVCRVQQELDSKELRLLLGTRVCYAHKHTDTHTIQLLRFCSSLFSSSPPVI